MIVPTVPVPFDDPQGHVEPHTAMIAFRACDYRGSVGWDPVALPVEDGEAVQWLYVKLEHSERVRFESNGTSPQATTVEDGLLPHVIHEVYPQAEQRDPSVNLRPEYQPPNYSGAAAVVEIPPGRLSSCGGGNGTRADTQVALNTPDGTFAVTSGAKKLFLRRSDAAVTIANLPMGDHHELDRHSFSQDHYTVYCAMVNGRHKDCAPPEWAAPNRCENESAQVAKKLSEKGKLVPVDPSNSCPGAICARIGLECANSTWP